MKYRRKTDANQNEVKSHLERIGYEVLPDRTSIAVGELMTKAARLFGMKGKLEVTIIR